MTITAHVVENRLALDYPQLFPTQCFFHLTVASYSVSMTLFVVVMRSAIVTLHVPETTKTFYYGWVFRKSAGERVFATDAAS